MKQLRFLFLSVSIFLLSSFSYSDHADWVLNKNENGIAVYTRLLSGTEVREVRVVNTVKSTLSGVVALLLDTKNYPNWVYSCSESRTLKVINEKELYNYQVTDLPWPFSDRDLICNFKIAQDSASRIVTFTKTGVPEYIPEKDPFVRVRHLQSNYKLIPLPDGSVQMELEVNLDPGGHLPVWLINANTISGPYKTTVSMIRQLPKYQSSSFSFIKEK